MKKPTKQAAAAIAIIVGLILLAPFASSFPDGLERTAEVNGFAAKANTLATTVFTGYSFPGVHSSSVNSILAGLVGAALVGVLGYVFGKMLRKNRRDR